MKTVRVVGRDWKFRALLRAQLLEEGYAALGFETLEEAAAPLGLGAPPAALVFDTTDALPGSFQPPLTALAARLPVVLVAAAGGPPPAVVAAGWGGAAGGAAHRAAALAAPPQLPAVLDGQLPVERRHLDAPGGAGVAGPADGQRAPPLRHRGLRAVRPGAAAFAPRRGHRRPGEPPAVAAGDPRDDAGAGAHPGAVGQL